MEFKELATLQKWYLKYTNRDAYKAYKRERLAHLTRLQERENEQTREEKFIADSQALPHPVIRPVDGPAVSFKHSGNSGDIIYSLPAAFALAGDADVRFFLHEGQPINNKNLYHPLGNIMLNDKMIGMLKPLLLHQQKIVSVEKFNGEAIHYDLDAFRSYNFYLDRGSIVRWYFLVYGVSYNTSLPWLTAPIDSQYADTIVIARSHRYRSPVVDYSFLNQYPNKLFLGLEEEYMDMRKYVFDLKHHPVTDFLEMATIIRSCRFFIGNQSFPFSIAEALKIPRLLEVHYAAPNVIVEGEGANDFMYQPQFESSVKRLYATTG